MEDINIPSPSAILGTHHPSTSVGGLSKPSVSPQKPTAGQPGTARDQNKPKQSKSRNGTVSYFFTSYFKWRPFEETNIGGKTASAKIKKGTSYQFDEKSNGLSTSPTTVRPSKGPQTQHAASSLPSLGYGGFMDPSGRFSRGASPPRQLSLSEKGVFPSSEGLVGQLTPVSFDEDIFASSLTDISPLGHSSWLSDIPAAAVGQQSGLEQAPERGPGRICPQRHDSFSFEALMEGDSDDIEEIVRNSDRSTDPGLLELAEIGMTPVSQASEVPSNIFREPIFEISSPEMLVLQFDRVTCGILSVKDGVHENPWRTLIWPLAKETPALYHAVFSLAAFHSSKELPALKVSGVDHMRKSIVYLLRDIQKMKLDAALATSLALAFAETWDQHTQTSHYHLSGAKVLIEQVLKRGLESRVYGNNLDRVRFLCNTWLYMDVISRLTSREKLGDREVDVSLFQSQTGAVQEIDPLMGCATTLFPLINQVARLIQRVRTTKSNSISLISQAIELKRLVEQWEPPQVFEPPEDPSSEVQHSIQTAHAYRWATLLYLHQAVPEMPSEPTSELAKRVLILLATVPPSSRTLIIQMFPLLAAGCEAEQEEDRQWVLSRWKAIQTRLMLGSIDHCIDIVRVVWNRRDAFEAEKQRRQLRGASGRATNAAVETFGDDRLSYTGLRSGERSAGSIYAKEHWRPRRSSALSPLENIEFEKTVRGGLHWITVMEGKGWQGMFELWTFDLFKMCI
ncbi:fungal specific transcription factor domain-containing protein [Aspergillus ibericus CBS 121593]|uniref:Putative C6 finger domain protein n=1 Tax=Aspergillus ibericus CBS 121593 TaxID=1448316 RepID=A0A395GS24_9EURO|nr:putative C6 finger domain protein [Aspergillus ibericus CBS 121593]RAK96883.1 putative C6 finger domain protein [Aspergillus ibericus CBS 121593]